VWKRNAKDVADAVSRLVLQVDAELVALTGDVRAVQLLQAVLPKEVVALVQVLDGSRSVDGSPGVDSQQLNAALAAVSAHDTTALLDKLAEEQGQDDRGAEGAKATAAALAMAQVQVLLVHDDPTDSRTAWFGSDPTLVALTAEELRDLGVDEPQSGRLVDVFLRSALGTGAGVRIVPEAGRVQEDVAAILRWA
jgi:peptide subunit release factor 1 (eRF1)